MSMLNCTRETKLATIFYVCLNKPGRLLKKPVPVTIEQIDKIPEIAKALVTYNDESLKMEKREEAMEFISDRVQKVLYNAIYIESNAVATGELLGLPGYEEMDKLISRQLESEGVHV